MADSRYSADRTMKRCRGALHRNGGEGVFLPLHRFAVLNKGRRAGKPNSECRDCWRIRQGTGYTVSVESILPLIERLVQRLGTQTEVCRRMGVRDNTISNVKKYKRVRGSFVEKLKALETEIAREDMHLWNSSMEPEVVEAEPLGQVLRDFCRDWFREYPKGWTDFTGPVEWLHQRTKRPAIGHEISVKQVSRICNSEKQFVAYTQADALLTAIGKSEMLSNGEIKVIANPAWSLEAYMAYMKDRGCI